MVVKKDSIKGEADVSTEEAKPEARADTSKKRQKPAEAKNTWVNKGEANVLTLDIGGTRYEFRKGEPVHLPPGQSPEHDDIERVSD
jgi:hypothetical protein